MTLGSVNLEWQNVHLIMAAHEIWGFIGLTIGLRPLKWSKKQVYQSQSFVKMSLVDLKLQIRPKIHPNCFIKVSKITRFEIIQNEM